MFKMLFAVATSLVAGFSLGAWVEGEPEAVADSGSARVVGGAPADIDERLRAIEQIVREERDARGVLEEQLLALMGDVEALAPLRNYADQVQKDIDVQAQKREAIQMGVRGGSSQQWGSLEAQLRESRMAAEKKKRQTLRKLGYGDARVEELVALEGEAELKSLEKRWSRRKALMLAGEYEVASSNALRDALGDDDYALYLESTGQASMVSIYNVVAGSTAYRSGIRAGDIIVSYNGRRMYTSNDIGDAVLQGDRGQQMAVEIERDGERIELVVAGGPLGVFGIGINGSGQKKL